MKQSYKEAIKYGLVGIVGLGIEWGAFFILRDIFHINYIVSHVISSFLGITNNFILNSYFTFRATDKLLKRAISYYSVALVGILISTTLLPIMVKTISWAIEYINLSINEKIIQNLGKLGATAVVVILQFFWNKYFTFKKKTE